jgi:hypothetical protein
MIRASVAFVLIATLTLLVPEAVAAQNEDAASDLISATRELDVGARLRFETLRRGRRR